MSYTYTNLSLSKFKILFYHLGGNSVVLRVRFLFISLSSSSLMVDLLIFLSLRDIAICSPATLPKLEPID
jgi:hypothetical protein